MVRKRVEDKPMDGIMLDTEVHETRTEIPKNIVEEDAHDNVKPTREANTDITEPVSCLRNEKVIVRFIPVLQQWYKILSMYCMEVWQRMLSELL